MRKELQIKSQQILALEEALSRRRNNGVGSNKLIWSLDNLSKHGMARYHGIFFAERKYGTKLAKLLVTESFIDEKDECSQKHEWTSSSTRISNEIANNTRIFVKQPDGVFAIPVCNIIRALRLEFFTSRVNGSIGLLKASFLNVLDGPVGIYLSPVEKEECMARLSAHRPTVQKFRAILSDSVGNRKKAARNMYLKSLGYSDACMPESKKDSTSLRESRRKQKELILQKCTNDNDQSDTSHWRMSAWETLCLITSSDEIENEMNCAEQEVKADGKVDNLFMNEAARRAFLVIRGYAVLSTLDEFSGDTSILQLARADASMTMMVKFINVSGKGGSRNENFVEIFRSLVAKAFSSIIKDVWNDLETCAPHELRLEIGDSTESDPDPYGNNIRDWTVVQKCPDDGHTYLLASPKYFKENVCTWYGSVKDGHVGRYNIIEQKFEMLTSFISGHELEESETEDN